MNDPNRRPGVAAEEAAAAYLKGQNWSLITANYRTSRGEIDIIALEGDCLVFVEVKSGRSTKMGIPALRVGAIKQNRLVLTARQYIADEEPIVNEYRFDVLSLIPNPNGEWQIEHFRDAFRPEPEE